MLDTQNVPEQIIEIYRTYASKIEAIESNRKHFISAFGLGNSPSKQPCHMEFLDNLKQASTELVAQSVSSDAALAALAYICYPTQERHAPFYTDIVFDSAHGQALPLVTALSPDGAAQLLAEYRIHYPRRQRLPMQQELVLALKKQANL